MTPAPKLPETGVAAIARLPRPHPDVVFCEVEEGAVLLSTRDETYYGLNMVGAQIWSLLPSNTTLDELCATLGGRYPEVDPELLRSDVGLLLEDLLRSGLVLPS